MSGCSTQFEATPGGLVLANAILLYKPDGGGRSNGAPAFASMHEVEHGAGGPVIEAGTPLTRGELRRWAEALGRTAVPEILPENVLVAHADLLAWWIPEQTRAGHFHISSPTSDLKALKVKASITVPYPAHLFIATRKGLGVYALPVSKRPTAETTVLHSPVLNVFIDGKLCWGNIAKPKALSVAAIAEYERAVFDSWSTHPNAGQNSTISRKGGLVRLWDDLATSKARRFPVRVLRPFYPAQNRPAKTAAVTLGQLIARAAK